jgi:hypothetical protein
VVSRPPRVVVFGGDLRKLARVLADLDDLELFGSTGRTLGVSDCTFYSIAAVRRGEVYAC